MDKPKNLLTSDLIQVVAEIDEFKGRWNAMEGQTPERLNALRKTATIESVGSSTRIEGAQLTDEQVETLLAGLKTTSFGSGDEQEVAGYAKSTKPCCAIAPKMSATAGLTLRCPTTSSLSIQTERRSV